MKGKLIGLVMAAALAAGAAATVAQAAETVRDRIEQTVDAAIEPLMQKDGIHGMAVGVIVAGKPYVFNYGLASAETREPVTDRTLFELGSVSKTFTATLASYAQVRGELSFSDPVEKYDPALRGTKFGQVALINLGTHTPGGVPLQVPDEVKNDAELTAYLKAWRPAYDPGTHRTYSNLSIGMLGAIAARSMDGDFKALEQQRLFPQLGLTSTYIDVPEARGRDYAQGYTKQGKPSRVSPGMLSDEAYGVKTTAADALRFMQENMDLVSLDDSLRQAVMRTHTGYFQAGPMTQDLIWEQYPYPVTLDALLEGNSPAMIFHPTEVSRLAPPKAPTPDAWINKTGSTNGFGAYIAFVPRKRMGIVMLANKNFPIDERVRVAYRILSALASTQP
ncbi:MAG TPA: class C beta-lactamase [Trinickia sp.]|nr:class C beta-lactamase [Trinickia sp.]